MALLRLLFVVCCVLLSMAFVVEGPRGGGVNAIDHLERAPRWDLTSGSLLETGQSGLGGGLEYAIDDSVCALRFIDGTPCEAVEAVIGEALQIWASGHPALHFTNVTGQVVPSFPLAAARTAGQGAEIDFFGVDATYFPPFLNPATRGYTIFYEGNPVEMVLTNGAAAQGIARIQSADVRFSAEGCYYLDPAKGRPACTHFPSLVLHEIGHALGIGHPDEQPLLNLDTDEDPSNRLAINCLAPAEGLRMSPGFEAAAVLVGRDVETPGRWRRGLTWDDVAARDALYPHCGIVEQARFSRRWGAVAKGEAPGRAVLARSEESADGAGRGALEACRATGAAECELVAQFSTCFADAVGAEGRYVFAVAATPAKARVDAMLACRAAGGACRIETQGCAFE